MSCFFRKNPFCLLLGFHACRACTVRSKPTIRQKNQVVNSVIGQTFQKLGLLKSHIHEATIDLKTVLCFLCNVEGHINANCQQHEKKSFDELVAFVGLQWCIQCQILVSEKTSQGKLLLGCGCVGDVFKSHGYFWLLCGHKLMYAIFLAGLVINVCKWPTKKVLHFLLVVW